MTIEKFQQIRMRDGRRQEPDKPLLWEQVVGHVKNMNLGEEVMAKVLHKARTVPPGAWRHFLQNINTHIANITKATQSERENEKPEQE